MTTKTKPDRYVVVSFDADQMPHGPSQIFVDVLPLGTREEAIASVQKARPYAVTDDFCVTADEFLEKAQRIKNFSETEVKEDFQMLMGGAPTE